jgi:hypothetical protein
MFGKIMDKGTTHDEQKERKRFGGRFIHCLNIPKSTVSGQQAAT